ncbi:MAG: hypothetical protein ACQGVC_25135 [Myxococcota bacterium]
MRPAPPLGPLLVCWLASAAALASSDALLREREVRGWDVVREAPVHASDDRDLAEWGVRVKHVRHYARKLGSDIQVCSVELWIFEDEGRAAAAAGGFHYPDWRIDRVGASLVMLHGSIRHRGGGGERGVFPDCEALGARVRDRAG